MKNKAKALNQKVDKAERRKRSAKIKQHSSTKREKVRSQTRSGMHTEESNNTITRNERKTKDTNKVCNKTER
jgi:hypothetical protein